MVFSIQGIQRYMQGIQGEHGNKVQLVKPAHGDQQVTMDLVVPLVKMVPLVKLV
jgi:hypothetical protein